MSKNLLKNSKQILDNPNAISNLKKEEIIELISRCKELLKGEPNLIKFDQTDKLLFIGDIHGNFESLIDIQKIISKNNYNAYQKIIFLGDFVDRGPRQIDSINYVLLLKSLYPKKIILLRGNHETTSMNEYYGFYNVVNNEFGGDFFKYYLEFYKTIPLSLYTNTGIFAVHGGIPDNLNDINEINKLNRFVFDVIDNDTSLMQLLWNDPTNEVKEFSSSFRGPGIKLFGKGAFQRFVSNNTIKLFIRAHEAFLEGYKFYFNNKLLSIFSAANYRAGNEAKLAEVDRKLKINLMTVG